MRVCRWSIDINSLEWFVWIAVASPCPCHTHISPWWYTLHTLIWNVFTCKRSQTKIRVAEHIPIVSVEQRWKASSERVEEICFYEKWLQPQLHVYGRVLFFLSLFARDHLEIICLDEQFDDNRHNRVWSARRCVRWQNYPISRMQCTATNDFCVLFVLVKRCNQDIYDCIKAFWLCFVRSGTISVSSRALNKTRKPKHLNVV